MFESDNRSNDDDQVSTDLPRSKKLFYVEKFENNSWSVGARSVGVVFCFTV